MRAVELQGEKKKGGGGGGGVKKQQDQIMCKALSKRKHFFFFNFSFHVTLKKQWGRFSQLLNLRTRRQSYQSGNFARSGLRV